MLEGLRIVDCSTEIAGPYCTKLLADAGADVVKVEPPDGDPLRRHGSGALFEFLQTSRRSVVGHPHDPHVLDLCAAADIVVENGVPGTFDVDGLRERRPGLVVTSITPFGQSGPWHDRPATEFTLQAWSGSTANRGLPEEPPVAAGGRIGEWMTGTYAAVASLAAWLHATRTGRGEHVDVALLDCMTLTMNTYTSVFAEFLEWPPLRRPTRSIEIPSIEPSADGYCAFTTNSAQQFADFLVLIDRTDLMDDRDLASSIGRFRRRDEILPMIHSHTTKHTTTELLEQATLLRIPSGPVGNGATVTGFDHFEECGTFVENPTGRFVQPRVPYRISGLTARPFVSAPGLGEHDGQVEWDDREMPPAVLATTKSTDASERDADDEGPLSGLRVLDCTGWWAGPAASHMLGCLGADVVKVESVTRPDGMRYTSTKPPTEKRWWEWGPLYHGANGGKRAITLDLTRPEGRALFLRLVDGADIVLENFTPRVMEQFGLGWDELHARNPALVMVRLPAYGLSGPWRDRTGFAQTMEGITGMAWVTGFPDGPPLLPRGACDPLAAMHAVFATMLALHDRAASGDGHLVEVTMIEAALNAAAEQVVEYGATGTLMTRMGNRGPIAAPQNLYACDGDEEWLALAVATDDQWDALRGVLGDPEWARDPSLADADGRRAAHDDLDAHLSTWCATRDAAALAAELCAEGVPRVGDDRRRQSAARAPWLHRGRGPPGDRSASHPGSAVPVRLPWRPPLDASALAHPRRAQRRDPRWRARPVGR